MREWSPGLRLAPPPRELLETLLAQSDFYAPACEEETNAIVPLESHVRGIVDLSEPEDEIDETLVYRPPTKKEEVDSENIRLGALVCTYEKRTDELEAARLAAIEAAARAEEEAERERERRALVARRSPWLGRALLAKNIVSEHRYKFIYSAICLWGIAQLCFAR